MRIVPKPTLQPGLCIASGKSESADGFVDFGPITGIDPNVYVSVSVLRDFAPKLGLVSVTEHDALKAELDQAHAELAEAQGELEDAARYRESVEWTLRSVGQKVARKPGAKKLVTSGASA